MTIVLLSTLQLPQGSWLLLDDLGCIDRHVCGSGALGAVTKFSLFCSKLRTQGANGNVCAVPDSAQCPGLGFILHRMGHLRRPPTALLPQAYGKFTAYSR